MTDEARAATVLLVGAVLVRLTLTDAYTRYVKAGMGPLLLAAGVILVILGLAGVVRALGPARWALPVGDGHDHGDRVAWLLLVPVFALLLVTPPALGSFGVDRGAAVNVNSGGRLFKPLPPGRTVQMTLNEYELRAVDKKGASFGLTPVRLTGFVAASDGGAGFRIARYQIACCAADAVAAVVRVIGATGDPPARDQWVTVTGTFQPSSADTPLLRATSLQAVGPPLDPYE